MSCSTWDVCAVSRCLVLAPCFDLQTKVCALLHVLLALVRPASAAFLRSVEDMRIFLKHCGLNLNVFSRIKMSAITSMLLMKSKDLCEDGSSA